MISTILHGDTIVSIKKFSWGDIEGVLLEYDKTNVFVPDSLVDKITEYRKESERFISQFTAERYLKTLEEMDRDRILQAKEKTFMYACTHDIRKGKELTEKQKKSIDALYEKYSEKIKESKQKRSSENDDAPF